ncbi:MAG: hypothetical protein QNK64_01775 [Saprospiraceae bacterium]
MKNIRLLIGQKLPMRSEDSIILVALISAQNQIQLSRAVNSCPSSFYHRASSMYFGVEFLF